MPSSNYVVVVCALLALAIPCLMQMWMKTRHCWGVRTTKRNWWKHWRWQMTMQENTIHPNTTTTNIITTTTTTTLLISPKGDHARPPHHHDSSCSCSSSQKKVKLKLLKMMLTIMFMRRTLNTVVTTICIHLITPINLMMLIHQECFDVDCEIIEIIY